MTKSHRIFCRAIFGIVLLITDLNGLAQQSLPDSLQLKIKEAKTNLEKFRAIHSAERYYLKLTYSKGQMDMSNREIVIAQEMKNDR